MTAGYVGDTTRSEKGDNENTVGVMLIYKNRAELLRYAADGPHVLGAKGVRSQKAWPKDYSSTEKETYTIALP